MWGREGGLVWGQVPSWCVRRAVSAAARGSGLVFGDGSPGQRLLQEPQVPVLVPALVLLSTVSSLCGQLGLLAGSGYRCQPDTGKQ